MATRKKSRRAARSEVKHVLLRGSRRNPVVMAASPRKTSLSRMAKFLKSHFPGSKIRVEKVKLK